MARHRESLNWLRRVPRGIFVTLYDKSDEPIDSLTSRLQCLGLGGRSEVVKCENVGHEAHSYLTHFARRADSPIGMADVTICCQGHPFDHCSAFFPALRALADGRATPLHWPGGFLPLGHCVDWDAADGSHLFSTWRKVPAATPLPTAAVWAACMPDDPLPSSFVFFCGGQFAVTAAAARRRSRSWYARAATAAAAIPHAAHVFERAWASVFCPPPEFATPPRWGCEAGGPAVWLKPTRAGGAGRVPPELAGHPCVVRLAADAPTGAAAEC